MLCIKPIYDFNLGWILKKRKKIPDSKLWACIVGTKKKKKKRWENANEKIVEKEISNL